jgi:hypothetical protein
MFHVLGWFTSDVSRVGMVASDVSFETLSSVLFIWHSYLKRVSLAPVCGDGLKHAVWLPKNIEQGFFSEV